MKKILFGISLIFASLLFTTGVYAIQGVGIGTGKIVVDKPLKTGELYRLPSIRIINTGDEPAVYKVGIDYHEKAPELRPEKNWFYFWPNEFALNPGDSKEVNIRLDVPIDAVPGNYFCYLQGGPILKTETGETGVGISAASKLYFTVEAANILQATWHRIYGLWNEYSPWTWIVFGLIIFFALIKIIGSFVHFNIGIKKRSKKDHES